MEIEAMWSAEGAAHPYLLGSAVHVDDKVSLLGNAQCQHARAILDLKRQLAARKRLREVIEEGGYGVEYIVSQTLIILL